MNDEKSAAPPTHHVYDGIEEQDNKLPNWWLAILYGTIIFAYGYWMFFHVTGTGKSAAEEFQGEMQARAAVQAAKGGPALTDESLLALSKDPSVVAKGQEGFKTTCAACHGADGQGLIGPNLTDPYWLHGAKPTQIVHTISTGVIEKGMPGWEPSLGAERIKTIAAYVLTLKNKNVPGKPPQGDKVEE